MHATACVRPWWGVNPYVATQILFGVGGDSDDAHAIRELPSLRWGIDHGSAPLRIVHVLTVPMTLPLDAELPEADATAAGVLQRARCRRCRCTALGFPA